MTGAYCLGMPNTKTDAHITAAERYALAEAALHARIGLRLGSACDYYGSLAAVMEAHPDLAPGFSGLPFEASA